MFRVTLVLGNEIPGTASAVYAFLIGLLNLPLPFDHLFHSMESLELN